MTDAATVDERLRVSPRLESLDFLRGLGMILMALDHVRHFFSNSLSVHATDLAQTDAPLFLTRWMTHFCAPAFVFLAGAGAFLSSTRGKTRSELARFLALRGLWLIFLELTVIRCFGWTFNFDYHYLMGGVIWALGWAMIVLAGLVYLPLWAIVAFGITMIGLHNLFDTVRPQSWGSFGWLWKVLHKPGQIEPVTGMHFKVAYPLIPWIGVMAAGYGFGALLLREPGKRRRWLWGIGTTLTLAFILIRALNIYGDPHRWSEQSSMLFTLFSFINCAKYPPSLLFLLMTLGPLILALALFDRKLGMLGRPFVVFGRVPLFFYLIHLPLIHGLAVVFSYSRYGQAHWLFENPPLSRSAPISFPEGYGYSLPTVYLLWLLVVLLLYPACLWFSKLKQRRRDAWLNYF